MESDVKVFMLAPNENWVCDVIVNEWNTAHQQGHVKSSATPDAADVIWLYADWCWRRVNPDLLLKKHVVCTVHHIVPEKFGPTQEQEFRERDVCVSMYHVPNVHTYAQVKRLTNKPVNIIPYWANASAWYTTSENHRKKFGLGDDEFVIGSFQRDTEGSDLCSPKLEKGPDLFVEYVELMNDVSTKPVHVLLGGWRRQYVKKRLTELGIRFTYIEKPTQTVIKNMYECLNVYPVTSRYEGGPMALIECGLMNVPVVSRDVGIASQVLPPEAINANVFNASPTVPRVTQMTLPLGFKPYEEMFKCL